ncbi:ABC transporter ATP-binding protein [Clostridium sp. CMCC3677]|uniref:ABC transporter ATP-binding protein n=1 Tax=Clostridium sp. CMCC3677 TaxID=2949963 RepID=UPI0013F0B7DB|nr:ABC transporter ATP-binding protein [Clostridium sp. CMCC3677]NFG62004.1 ABC transporter ATP-binding protein [Clostridium botulinum]NFQ08328.1 ABC transporter ATP-binding protein [Clostridium botulinum]
MKRKKEKPLALLFKWAEGDKYYLYSSIFCAFISGICIIIPYLCIYNIIDVVFKEDISSVIIFKNAVIIGASVIIRCISFGTSGILSHKGAYKTLFKVRCMVNEHMAKIPLGHLNERSTGEIKKVLNEDIEKLELFLAHHLPELVMYASGPLAVFIYLCTVNLKLALISLTPIPIALLCQCFMFCGVGTLLDEMNSSLASLNSTMIEYISGMRLIKAYNMGSKSFEKYAKAIKDQRSVWKRMSRKMGIPFSMYVIIIECGLILIAPIGGIMLLNENITASTFILFAFVGSLYLTELRPLLELGSNFSQVLNGVIKIKEILDIPMFKGGTKEFPKNHDIILKNVDFSYDGKTNVLKNVNLNIKDGEKIAMIGKSGNGKSTIVQLIARFYDINQGEILIGEKNIKDIDYETLLQNVAIVFQKTFLSSGSVFENIAMGKKSTLEEVRSAAKKAQIDDFIINLPNGYNTLVGGYGSRFSGGQKQRIAIARAILKNAPILILDEATSAADPENQVEIDKAMYNLCEGKTVIIVAHQLGLVQNCNRVAVVENNTIEIIGTHEEVLNNNKYYKKSWHDYNEARNISYVMEGGVSNE